MTTQLDTPEVFSFAPGLEKDVVEDHKLLMKVEELAEEVVFAVAPTTISGRKLQEARGRLFYENLNDYRPDGDSLENAVQRLKALGFQVRYKGRFSITVAGPARLIQDVLGVTLRVHRQPRRATDRSVRIMATDTSPPAPDELFVAPPESLSLPSSEKSIDNYVFIPPPHLFALPSPTVPSARYPHLGSEDIARLLGTPGDVQGQGVEVAIIDTGFAQHPYYAPYSVKVLGVPGGPPVGSDANGHGTTLAFNVFAVAPKATVLMLGRSAVAQDAIEIAVESGARILSCSWGWSHEQSFPMVEASIRSVIEDDGAIVLFASGNGQIAWPASMPQVTSIGGVYADPQNGFQLEASNFASGFVSSLYPPRQVPDVSGLSGQAPLGIYIGMPCPISSHIECAFAGKTFPDGDETTSDDGWVFASGTSAATAQIAGVVALMVERARERGASLSPQRTQEILKKSATPVQRGRNALGFPAVGHPNVACGYGLVNARAALAAV